MVVEHTREGALERVSVLATYILVIDVEQDGLGGDGGAVLRALIQFARGEFVGEVIERVLACYFFVGE